MDERFAELLAKGRTGQLTPGETEELARLLNAPILDSLESPAPGFVSKRDFAPRDLATTLRAIDWFAHIAIVHSVQWDVLGALMENSYLGSRHRCFFFLELLSVYGAGHFPCGWRGEWPQGALIVY